VDRKRKDQPLAEYLADLPKGTRIDLPWNTLSKDDYHEILGDPLRRIGNLMQTASNRDLVVEAVGLLDTQIKLTLTQFIATESAKMIPGRGAEIKNLESKSLASKIDLAFRLGLISLEEQKELHMLRKVRNCFAHDPDLHNFEIDEEVLGLVQSVPPRFDGPAFEISPRQRFATLAMALHWKLSQQGTEAIATARTV